MEVRGTPDERLKKCLEDMGVAVLNGAVSTFLAVLMLGGYLIVVFITFFRQLFPATIVIGAFAYGLIPLPCSCPSSRRNRTRRVSRTSERERDARARARRGGDGARERPV